MGFIGFIRTFVFFFFAALIVFSFVGRFIPWARNKGWKSRLAFILISVVFAYSQGLRVMQRFTEEKLDHIQHDNPPSSIDIGYFVGDFLPTLKLLGGTITPEMWEAVRHIAKEGTPGHAAMARKLLDESVDAR